VKVVETQASGPASRLRLGRIAIAAVVIAVAILLTVERMRWSLPARYLFKPLDIHRTGLIDFTMCMRAELSPREARAFTEAHFEPRQRIAREVSIEETLCPAPFWPPSISALTLGYSQDVRPDGIVDGTTGAVYENGYLYFWANDQ
jgi:hypothetical protein